MSFNRRTLRSACIASIAPASCILAAGLYITFRTEEFRYLDDREDLRRVRVVTGYDTYVVRRHEKDYGPDVGFPFRIVTLHEDLAYGVVALLYGVSVGWIGVFYLAFLHAAELCEVPVWFRGAFFLASLCHPWAVLRWWWETHPRVEQDEKIEPDETVDTCERPGRNGLSKAVCLGIISIFVVSCHFLIAPHDFGFPEASFYGCCFIYLGGLGEENAHLFCVKRGQIVALAAVLGIFVVVGLVHVMEKLNRTRGNKEMKGEEDGEEDGERKKNHGREPPKLERIMGAEENIGNDESAEQKDPTPNDPIDRRLDPFQISTDTRRRAEYLVHLANKIATMNPPEAHSTAIHKAIQRDRATQLAHLYTQPLDTAAAPQAPLDQAIAAHFAFLTPPLSVSELGHVRDKIARGLVSAGSTGGIWEDLMEQALRDAHCGVVLLRANVKAFVNDEALLDAAVGMGIGACFEMSGASGGGSGIGSSSSSSNPGSQPSRDHDASATTNGAQYRRRKHVDRAMSRLVQALVFDDYEGGYAKLWCHLEILKSEERVLRQNLGRSVDSEQELKLKMHERRFLNRLLQKLDLAERGIILKRRDVSGQGSSSGINGRREREELRLF